MAPQVGTLQVWHRAGQQLAWCQGLAHSSTQPSCLLEGQEAQERLAEACRDLHWALAHLGQLLWPDEWPAGGGGAGDVVLGLCSLCVLAMAVTGRTARPDSTAVWGKLLCHLLSSTCMAP